MILNDYALQMMIEKALDERWCKRFFQDGDKASLRREISIICS